MKNCKSIRFNCDLSLLSELDGYRSRHVSRTEMLEAAIERYLADLKQGRVQHGKNEWLAR